MAASAPTDPDGRSGALLDAIAAHRREVDQGTAAVAQGAGDRHRRTQIAQDVVRAEQALDAAVLAALAVPDGPADDDIADAAAITPDRLEELRGGGPSGA